MHFRLLIGVGFALTTLPAAAQLRLPQGVVSTADREDGDQLPQQQERQTPLETNPTGSTARSSVGQAGQRQTRDTAAEQAGIKPMARIASRIQNRVQNRIRNRIDRNYDPQANANDPFITAEEQARTSGRSR